MTHDEQKELWRWAVNSRAFRLLDDLGELRSTFMVLAGNRVVLSDRWAIAERQMRICALELKNLRDAISNIYPFDPQDDAEIYALKKQVEKLTEESTPLKQELAYAKDLLNGVRTCCPPKPGSDLQLFIDKLLEEKPVTPSFVTGFGDIRPAHPEPATPAI